MAVRQTNSKIPRSHENDYTQDAAAGRREFLRDRTGVTREHVSECSFDPSVAQGNVENFIGVAQVEKYSAARILFCRFNYTTGDAAGQNLTGKATAVACEWIRAHYPKLEHYFLESNFATDKKSSQVNMLNTRGKRVIAEATIPSDLIRDIMHADTALLWRARLVSNLGGFMSGANNNGAHAATASSSWAATARARS
jgi:hydroxymethylglutaryl-CoA reductase